MWYVFLPAGALLVLFLWWDTIRPTGFPPGPPWLPLIGNVFLTQKLKRKYDGQHGVFEYLSRKYNTKLIGMRLGSEIVVAVRGYPLVKEALTRDEFCGRPDNFFSRMRTFGKRLMGVTFTDGEHWEEHRSFTVRTLRELGFGRNTMNELINNELAEIIQTLERTNGSIAPVQLLSFSVLNVIWALATGKRIEQENNTLKDLFEILRKRSTLFDISGGLLNQIPWIRFLAPEWTGYSLLLKLNQRLASFFTQALNDHFTNYDDLKSSDDFIYAFIREMNKRSHDPNTTFTETQLVVTLLDLFIAANITTVIINLIFMMMILRPEIQANVHREIDAFKDSIRWKDRHNFSYVEAVIFEVQRFFYVAAISGPRRAMQDCELGGYKIPQNATVLIDLKSVHMDEEYWIDPGTFRPERFLDQNGQLVNTERLIPFSLGKRKCLGDGLARACIFVYFCGIMQRYEITTPEGEEPPSVQLIPGITYLPKPYKAIFKLRGMKQSNPIS
ncbi:probable cytochrome P450 305a1 [Malaya genurostris]|uniref:probable cytochrome P450 305a1 n=1 Tax=Malaya genurostris TaxID=325434 RepID=UPI0026F4028C|nr:probable cytochrome P450 305a1 [Malaya genurostris]